MHSNVKKLASALFAGAMLLTQANAIPDIFIQADAASLCTVNTDKAYQTIKGFGGMNHPEWAGDLTDAQRATAFGNGENQLGLSICRVFVNDNSNQWNRALATAKYAQSNGAIVFASPWNPPSSMTETFSKQGAADAKRLKKSSYGAYADHLNNFVKYMRNNGVDLYAISIQNEPDWGFDWTWWTEDECVDFLANYGNKIEGCKVMSPESFSYKKSYYEKILANSQANANVDIWGTHFYGTSRQNMDFPKLENDSREIFMTEVYTDSKNDADVWPMALDVSENIHNGLVVGNMNAYVWWYIRRSYSPIKENGQISKRGYCMAQYSKFVRPGDIRIDATEQPEKNVYISAYKNSKDQVTIVAINKSDSGYTQQFSLGGKGISDVDRWRTSANENLAKTDNLEIENGSSFWAQLPAQSVSTFVVTLNGGSATVSEPESLSGKLIKELKVNDTENASDWSICNNMNSGANVYGDRDITIVSVPTELINAEAIRTACDSKLYTEQLALFTAGEDIAVYAAVDTRVSGRLDWLKNWTDTGAAVTTSNDVTLELFRTEAKSGTQVVLGTNGGDNESANYIVYAVPLASDKPIATTTTSITTTTTSTTAAPVSAILWGDANCDGNVTVADAVAILQYVANADKYPLNENGKRNADVYNNGDGITARDALSIQMLDANILASLPESFSPSATTTTTMTTTTTTTTIATTTAIIASNFNYNPNLQYKKAPDAYRKDCAQQGKVEKVTYKTTVYGNNIDKSAYVYLPYGYDSSKQYNIMYMMHGGGGNESSIFIESTVMKKYLDWMIMNGDIEPMIVVTPTFNNAAGSDMTANAKNFWNELAKDVVPAIESKYSTYAKSTSAADLKASRSHRAFSGFSMGSLTSWYVFLNDLDYFQYVMPLSGDCWAGNTADEKAAAVANAAKKSGYAKNEYFLMCATGTKDIAYSAMNDQLNSMKKLTDTFTYTSDFSKGNLYFLVCDGGSHWWDGYIVDYIYDAMPYLFHE